MVTVAGGGLQLGAIADRHLAPAVADRATQLELLGSERCRGPPARIVPEPDECRLSMVRAASRRRRVSQRGIKK
jgi:hypothetical protein